jgi:hypothetical protein
MLIVHNFIWVDASAPSLLDSSRQLRSGALWRKFVVSFADSGPNYGVKMAHKPVDVHTSYDSWLCAIFPCSWTRPAANFTTNMRKNSKAEGLLSGLQSANRGLRFCWPLTAGCWRLRRFLGPVLLQISQRTIEKIIRRKGYQAICDPRSAIRGLRSALRELRSAICVLRSAVCGPRTANRDPRTAICVFFWLLTKQSAIGIPDSPVFRKML